jgi:malic enzyme
VKKSQQENGEWGYYAGVSGTVNVAAGRAVLGIGCQGTGSITINGGAAVLVDGAFSLTPEGLLVAPVIVFTGTTSYFVETVA